MTVHAIVEYIKYSWNAQGRHGVHSPFVYALVEDVLQNRKGVEPVNAKVPCGMLPGKRYDALLRRIMGYYRYMSVARLAVAEQADTSKIYDVLLPDKNKPQQWRGLIDTNKALIGNDSMVMVPDIHRTGAHTQGWHAACAAPGVRMSIDLYGVGLLFFKKEFKERQHFVLKV